MPPSPAAPRPIFSGELAQRRTASRQPFLKISPLRRQSSQVRILSGAHKSSAYNRLSKPISALVRTWSAPISKSRNQPHRSKASKFLDLKGLLRPATTCDQPRKRPKIHSEGRREAMEKGRLATLKHGVPNQEATRRASPLAAWPPLDSP